MVLIQLSLRANVDGECWPSLDQLARDCRLHRATVVRRLEELERVGWLNVARSKGRTSNRYQLSLTANVRTEQPSLPATQPSQPAQVNRRSQRPEVLRRSTTEEPKGEPRPPKASRRKPETDIPEYFDAEIRPAAVAWAGEKLKRPAAWANQRIDLMLSKCRAKGYRYRDWLHATRNWLEDDHVKELEREQRFGKPPGAVQHEKQRREDGHVPWEQRPESRRFDAPQRPRGGPPSLAFGGNKT
jgi:DNA-binding MarR family transcriptional regulator